jgi:CCR4-NOT transcription complex subunit 9
MDHQLGYNAYQRSLYAESPSSIAAAIAHPTPHPPVPQFINDPHTLPHGLSTSLPITTNDENNIYALVIDLLDPESRESALLDLSKKREQYDDLALVLWHAFGQPYFPVIPILVTTNVLPQLPGIMPALLQEIVSVYPMLSPPNLTAHVSNRVCNALALLQCVASHPETRQLFLNGICLYFRIHVILPVTNTVKKAHIPLFLYPFLNTTSKTRPFEYLRLTSLGVIGALVKVCSPLFCSLLRI